VSRPHIRVAKPVARRKPWLERAFFVSFALLVLAGILFVLWDRPHEPFETTHGRVLDMRIVVDGIRQSIYGGRISYRLEVRVNYDLVGTPQDRWITTDTVTSAREEMAAKIARNPKQCLVYWKPNHPESARCHLE
jgi:hypothetical protein